MFEPDGDGVGDVAAVFAASEAPGGVLRLDSEDGGHRVLRHNIGHLCGCFARGIERAEDGAHAGSSDHVDGDVVLLEPGEHTDFGHGKGTAAAQSYTDDGAVLWKIGGWNGRRERSQTKTSRTRRSLTGDGGFGSRARILTLLLAATGSILVADTAEPAGNRRDRQYRLGAGVRCRLGHGAGDGNEHPAAQSDCEKASG